MLLTLKVLRPHIYYSCLFIIDIDLLFLYITLRDHPFNLKGGGDSVSKFVGKNISDMSRKNILLGLCAIKYIVFVEKNISAAKKTIAPHPHPFKLNGCFLNAFEI